MKFIVRTQSFEGGYFKYSSIEVEDSAENQIVEYYHWWHDDIIYEEHDQIFLDFLIKVYNDLQLRKFGFTDCVDHDGLIIKDYSDIINNDTKYIIPFNNHVKII